MPGHRVRGQCARGRRAPSPVNVQASVTDERVTLTWQGNVSDSQVTGYRIERYEGHRSGWHRLEAFLPAANQVPWDNPDILETYVDTNVLPSGPYRYRIRSVNSQGIISRYTGEATASALIVPGREAMKRTGKPPVKQASTTDRRPLRSASAQGLRCGGPGLGVQHWTALPLVVALPAISPTERAMMRSSDEANLPGPGSPCRGPGPLRRGPIDSPHQRMPRTVTDGQRWGRHL